MEGSKYVGPSGRTVKKGANFLPRATDNLSYSGTTRRRKHGAAANFLKTAGKREKGGFAQPTPEKLCQSRERASVSAVT